MNCLISTARSSTWPLTIISFGTDLFMHVQKEPQHLLKVLSSPCIFFCFMFFFHNVIAEDWIGQKSVSRCSVMWPQYDWRMVAVKEESSCSDPRPRRSLILQIGQRLCNGDRLRVSKNPIFIIIWLWRLSKLSLLCSFLLQLGWTPKWISSLWESKCKFTVGMNKTRMLIQNLNHYYYLRRVQSYQIQDSHQIQSPSHVTQVHASGTWHGISVYLHLLKGRIDSAWA